MASDTTSDLKPREAVIVQVLALFTGNAARKGDVEETLADIIRFRGLDALSEEEYLNYFTDLLQQPSFLTASGNVSTVAVINFSARLGEHTHKALVVCGKVTVMTVVLYLICSLCARCCGKKQLHYLAMVRCRHSFAVKASSDLTVLFVIARAWSSWSTQ